MKRMVMRLDPDTASRSSSFLPYVFDTPPSPVKIYINGEKIEAPNAGVKIGRPLLPDISDRSIALEIGDFIKDKEKDHE